MPELARTASAKPEGAFRSGKPDRVPPRRVSDHDFRGVSNHALQRLLEAGVVQAKLEVGAPGDAYELEADAMADRVMRMPAGEVASPPELDRVTSASSAQLQRAFDETTKTEDDEEPKKKEEEEEKKEEKVIEVVQRKEASSDTLTTTPDIDSTIDSFKGRGAPLPDSERSFFEPRFGRDLSGVRLHTGADAAASARALDAQAYTVGDNVVFGAGRYAPGSASGRRLMAHELMHVVQQRPDRARRLASSSSVDASPGGERVSRQAAPAVADEAPAAPVAEAPPAPAEAEPATGEAGEPTEEMVLDGMTTFTPPSAVATFLAGRGTTGGPVHVRFGSLASGIITVRETRGKYATVDRPRIQSIPLTHPGLEPLRTAGVEPVLVVGIREDAISGYISIRRGESVLPNPTAITDWIRDHPTEMGWMGLSDLRVPGVVNTLEGGVLRLRVEGLRFSVGGFLSGTGSLGLENEALDFSGSATVRVAGLSETQLEIARDPTGVLSGRVEIPVTLASFSGNVLAVFSGGIVDITGRVRYATDKLTGELTLLVTDAATARNVALQRLDPSQVEASAEETAAPAAEGPRPGPRALAGWGVLDFAFTEWLTGQAQVIVDNEGHITVIGEIAPPARVELFPQRDYIRRIFTIEVRTLYGVPLVGNVFLFANIGLDAMAKLGPGTLYNITVAGTYSTDPRVFNNFSLAATLNISAFAGLRLRGEGGVGVEIVDHDIKAGVGVNALAGVRGYVEATPTIGYREVADPVEGRQGEFFVHGHMELAAQPFLGLSGDLFVELDSPWWSPAPDEKWTWPLGELEYPLPGEFGIGADVDYVLGSDELPEIEFGEVDFNADRFMTDLMNDHVPPASQGEQERPGEWAEGEATGAGEVEPGAVDTQGAPPEGEAAQGQAEPAPDDDPTRPPEQPQPEVVKAAALEDLEQRLSSGALTSTDELQAAVQAVYSEHSGNGLISLDVDVPDPSTMDMEVTATASDPTRRIIEWSDAFAPDEESRALFERAPRYETNALISVNREVIGEVVASDEGGHAEQNLISRYWAQALERVRNNPDLSIVVFAINRAPCHTICTPALMEAMSEVDDALLEKADFILAPTGTYEPTENMTDEEIEAGEAKFRAVAQKLRAAGREVQDYTVVSRARLLPHRTRMADLDNLAAAGWDIRQLAVRAKETSAGVVLAEAAHQVAVRAGRAEAGS